MCCRLLFYQRLPVPAKAARLDPCSDGVRKMRAGERIRRLVIVGGGTAGWMAAASLAHHFRGAGPEIVVVESSEIGTVGVGEATIPTIRRFYGQMGISDAEMLRATQGTCKLGIRFVDWDGEAGAFIHPFGLFGIDLGGVGFHHHWLRLRAQGAAAPLGEYSLGASMAAAGRFQLPRPSPRSTVDVYDWALHLDASLLAAYLRKVAEDAGCRRIDGRIVDVTLRGEDGFIDSLVLEGGEAVPGDLFVDCSGFRGLLIGEALGVGFEDWSRWLLTDRAYAVQSSGGGALPPYTEVTARTAGWQWRIPLRHRTGNGLVFSSRHMSDDEARAELLRNVGGELLGEPRRLCFRPGRRTRVWEKNCVALGLAGGFLEPLESTSIALIETGIERLKQLFPDRRFDPAPIAEYNDVAAQEMERVRDFIILHYKLNQRAGLFWQMCRNMEVPESLGRKMALWRSRGHFARYSWEMFSPASWLAIFAGFGDLPEGWDPAADALDQADMYRVMEEMRHSIAAAAKAAPTHQAYIDSVGRAPQGVPARRLA